MLLLSEKKKGGCGPFLQKNGHSAKVQLVDGGGLYTAPHPRFDYHGTGGLFEKEGSKHLGN